MNENVVISVENISKSYIENHFVLKNVSFTVYKGEVLGILGNNGAGKSTLLKILSGYLKPTNGVAYIAADSAGILDIGSGFHPDLTGYENISFILKMSNSKQSQGVIKDIIAFSELGDNIYNPVKTYSSGMFMRLALSTYLIMNFSILFIDEVFSTGDIHFQQKVKNFIASKKGQVSIILASHDLNLINSFADRCIWMKQGEIFQIGDASDVVEKYLENHFFNLYGNGRWLNKEVLHDVYKDEFIEIQELYLMQDGKYHSVFFDLDFQIQMKINSKHSGKIFYAARIQDLNGREVHIDSPEFQSIEICLTESGSYTLGITYPKSLFSIGMYKLSMIFWIDKNKVIEVPDIGCFELKMNKAQKTDLGFELHTISRMPLNWSLTKSN